MKLKKHFELVMADDKVLCKVELGKVMTTEADLLRYGRALTNRAKGDKDGHNIRQTRVLQRL